MAINAMSFLNDANKTGGKIGATSFLSAASLERLNATQVRSGAQDTSTAGKNNGGPFGGIGYLGHKVGLGFLSGVEGIWDYASSGIAKLFGEDEWAERQVANDWVNYNSADEWFDPGEGWKVAGDVAGGIGTSLPSIAAVAAGAATIYFSGGTLSAPASKMILAGVSGLTAGLSAAGNATKEAYRETGELTGKEYGYGALVGMTEAAIETISGKIGTGTGRIVKGIADKTARNTAKSVAKTVAKKTAGTVLKNLAVDFAQEAFEEGVAEIMSPVYARLTYDPDAEKATAQEILYASLVGGLSGLVMSGTGSAVNTTGNYLSGNKLAQNNKAASVMETAKQFAESEAAHDTGITAWQNVRTTYETLQGTMAQTGGEIRTARQKMLLGELNKQNAVAAIMPEVERSARNMLANPEAVAKAYTDFGVKDTNGKAVTFTAEQIREGVDMSDLSIKEGQQRFTRSLRKALTENHVLSTLAIADATGHLMMDTARFANAEQSALALASESNFNQFVEKASAKEKAALGERLGIEDWSKITYEQFRAAVGENLGQDGGAQLRSFAEQQRRVKAAMAEPIENARPVPHTLRRNMKDGVYRFSDSNTQMAVIKEGESYFIVDYDTRNISNPLAVSDVNRILKQVRDGASARTAAESVAPMQESAPVETSAPAERLAIGRTVDNKPFVEIDRDILAGVPESDWVKTVKKNLFAKFPSGVVVGNSQIAIDSDSRKELTYSEYMKWLRRENPDVYADKLRATDNADEILSATTDWVNEPPNHERKDDIIDFARGRVLLRIGKRDYTAEVVVGTRKNHKMRLYDITNLGPVSLTKKETSEAIPANPSPGTERKTSPISTDSITETAEKSNTFSEKSAQESASDSKKRADFLEAKAIDAWAKENVPDYNKLAENARLAVRATIRRARAHGIAEADIKLYANVAAHSGLKIVFDVTTEGDGLYDMRNTIYVKPSAPAERIRTKLLLHEGGHALFWRTKKGKRLMHDAAKMLDADKAKEIEERYTEYYEKKNVPKERYLPIIEEEIAAAALEDVLGSTDAWEYILAEDPQYESRLISFFAKAAQDYKHLKDLPADARKLMRQYKKLFQELSTRNQGNNATDTRPAVETERSVTRMNDENMQVTKQRAAISNDTDLLDLYSEEQYNNFGWIRGNDVLTAGEWKDFEHKFSQAVKEQSWYPQTAKDEYMIAVSDIYDSHKNGVNNIIVYAKGTIDSPRISRVLKIELHKETELDVQRRDIYALEGRGIQQKAGGIFRCYAATDIGYQTFKQGRNTRGGRDHYRLGADRGGSGGKTQGAASPLLPVVHTFTDIAGKKRNIRRVGSEYMIEGDTRSKYAPSIKAAIDAENKKVVSRYARKYNRTEGWVRRMLSEDPAFFEHNDVIPLRLALPEGERADGWTGAALDIEKFDASRYNEIELPKGEQIRLQSEALTWDTRNRNELRMRTLSNGIAYRYLIDNEGVVHVYSRGVAGNIHERGENYDNRNREQPDRFVEKLRSGQRNNDRSINFVQDGREASGADRRDHRSLLSKGNGNRARNSNHGNDAYLRKKAVEYHFDEDGSGHGTVKYSDGTLERFALPETDKKQTSGKAASDTVTMSKGELAKLRANYQGDKVFYKKDVEAALGEIEAFSSLPAEMRRELKDRLFQGYNSRLHQQGFDMFTQMMYDRIRATILQESHFDMDSDAIAKMDQQLVDALHKIVATGRPSIRTKMREAVESEVKAETDKLQREAKHWREEYEQNKQANKVRATIADQVQRIRERKLGTFHNVTQYKCEIFKDSLDILTRVQWRGNVSVDATRKAMTGLRQWYSKDNPMLAGTVYSDDIAAMLEALETGEGVFSLGEYQMISDVLSYFNKFADEWNKVFHQGKWVEAEPMAKLYVKLLQESQNRPKGLAERLLRTKVARGYNEMFGDPSTVARMMDSYEDGFFTGMLAELREGAMGAQVAEMEIRTEYEAFLEKNKGYLDRVSAEEVEYRGHKIPRITLIGLYMTLKRDQAKAGFAASGFAFDNIKGERVRVDALVRMDEDVTTEDLTRAADDERGVIGGKLTKEDKAYIAILEKVYNEDAKRLKAERDMQRLGFTNATEGYYYPIRRGNIAKSVDAFEIAAELDRVSHASFNKNVVKGAKQELFIESADRVFNRHLRAVCQYAYLSPVIEAYDKIFNLDTSGNPNSPVSVATESANVWKEGNAYFKKLISDIQGIPTSSGEGMRALGKIRGAYAKYQLGANPKVWFSQLSSFFAAYSQLDADSITRGAFVSGKDVDTYCPLAKLRNYDNTAAAAQGVLDTRAKRAARKVDKIGDAMMAPIGYVDRFVVTRLFGACQVQVEKDGGAKIGTKANKEAAGKLLEQVIFETQQNAIATERSAAMRSGNEILRTLTMFSADGMKVIGRVIDGLGEVSYLKAQMKGKTGEARSALQVRLTGAQKRARKAIAALLTQAMFMTGIAQLFRWLYAKERDEDEPLAQTLVLDTVGNMLGGLPGVRDVYTRIVDGYDMDNYAYSAVNDLLNSAVGVFEAVGTIFSDDPDKQAIPAALRKLTYAVGQVTGIPVRNLYNVFYGLTKRVSSNTAYKIDDVFYAKNYRTDLYKALEDGDDDRAAFLMSLVMEERVEGGASESVRAELLSLLKSEYSVLPRAVPEEFTYNGETVELTDEQQVAMAEYYADIPETLEALFARADYRALTEEQRADAISRVYDTYRALALSYVTGVDMTSGKQKIAGVVGLDALAMLQVATKDLTSDVDKNGNTVAGSKRKKVVAAINSLGISDEQKLLLICAQGYSLQDGDVRRLSATAAKKRLLRYILSLKVSKAEKEEIAKMCGFEVRNGRIIAKNAFSAN